jgi:hypothetical protein
MQPNQDPADIVGCLQILRHSAAPPLPPSANPPIPRFPKGSSFGAARPRAVPCTPLRQFRIILSPAPALLSTPNHQTTVASCRQKHTHTPDAKPTALNAQTKPPPKHALGTAARMPSFPAAHAHAHTTHMHTARHQTVRAPNTSPLGSRNLKRTGQQPGSVRWQRPSLASRQHHCNRAAPPPLHQPTQLAHRAAPGALRRRLRG